MTRSTGRQSARARILETAYGLFYRQGYHATGINQIIEDSGVAKATFYNQFASKDDLWLAYAQERHRRELEEFRAAIRKYRTPRERFYAPLKVLVPWFKGNQYRGCPFQNLLAEVPQDGHPVQREAQVHKDALRNIFKEVALDLIEAHPEYARLDPEALAATYQLLFEGAIATSVTYRQLWPVEHAVASLKNYLHPKR